jgi:hypothetical protein
VAAPEPNPNRDDQGRFAPKRGGSARRTRPVQQRHRRTDEQPQERRADPEERDARGRHQERHQERHR